MLSLLYRFFWTTPRLASELLFEVKWSETSIEFDLDQSLKVKTLDRLLLQTQGRVPVGLSKASARAPEHPAAALRFRRITAH